ncbi:hypothetical protein KR018_007676 [Drosophila ironensis]|nr:hypothetical protein KR018_007676 [Drosophila ironensis]
MESLEIKNLAAAVNSDKLEVFRNLHLVERHRVDSFKSWPFPEQSSCSMAEAGFYWSGTMRENDTATCFVCGKTLDGWESEDDPWEEHGKHAPQCEFVKMGTAEKDLTVSQFLEFLSIVVKGRIENTCKVFKQKFTRENETRLEEFMHQLK